MKKILPFLLMAFVGLFAYSCDDKDDVVVQGKDSDTVALMRDATGTFTSGNNFTLSLDISIASTDVVLVYRNVNSNTNNPVSWQLLPKTYYLTGNRELDYNFTFDSKNVDITTQANFDQTTMSGSENAKYLVNQTFRTVLVPANANKNAKPSVDYSDYNAVIKYYNLDDSKVQIAHTKAN